MSDGDAGSPRAVISFTRNEFEAAIERLIGDEDIPGLVFHAGINRTPEALELIGREPRVVPDPGETIEAPVVLFFVEGGRRPVGQLAPGAIRYWRARAAGGGPLGLVWVDLRAPGEPISGWIVQEGDVEPELPLASVRLIGPGCRKLATATERPPRDGPIPSRTEREVWNRQTGVIGEDAWGRLRSIRCTLIGGGRTGSHAAETLIRSGVREDSLPVVCEGEHDDPTITPSSTRRRAPMFSVRSFTSTCRCWL